ncbi:MAG: exodeoxyribonuclease VII large subunit [Alphaproteobacteria bacterium]
MFDACTQTKIPFCPKPSALSPAAAAPLFAILSTALRDRFPSHILLWPAPVQGEGAAEKIAAAIEGFNNLRRPTDIRPNDRISLIVARGGGSLEDLWPFNEECSHPGSLCSGNSADFSSRP